MKKLILAIIIFVVTTFTMGVIVYAEDTPTTTTDVTTTEVTTTEVPTTVDESIFDITDYFGDTSVFDAILSIVSLVYMIVVTVLAISGQIKAMVAKKAEQKATTQLSVSEKVQTVLLNGMASLSDILNIIVQNSKISTDDKLTIASTVTTFKQNVNKVSALVSQIAGLDASDVSSLLSNLTDLASIGTDIINAVKTGDKTTILSTIEDITNKVGE